jgi:hypothetical protein
VADDRRHVLLVTGVLGPTPCVRDDRCRPGDAGTDVQE